MKSFILSLCLSITVVFAAQKQNKAAVQNQNKKARLLEAKNQKLKQQRNLQYGQLPNAKLRGASLLTAKIASSASIYKTITSMNEINSSNNLTAVIHIGPMKTGSSAIQLSLGKVYTTLKDIDHYEDAGFAMDNGIEAYHMVGCFRPDAVPHTGRPDYFEISCHPNALEQVAKVAERNNNLMITAEYLTDPKTDLVKFKEFLKPWKNHRIVAYYRRYYDWLLSFHNQIYKQHETPVTRKSLTDFLQNEMNHKFFYETMYLNKAIERYQEHGFNDVQVINLYDLPNHDVRESFYCNGLVNATASCNKFREYVLTEKRAAENPSTPLIYNELAYYAKEMGLWNDKQVNDIGLKAVSKLAQEYHNRKLQSEQKTYNAGMPLYAFHDSGAFICPSTDVYDWLFETSIEIEKTLFPQYYSQQGEHEMFEHFNLLIFTKKFCHIDAQLILQNDNEWKTFFQSLSTI